MVLFTVNNPQACSGKAFDAETTSLLHFCCDYIWNSVPYGKLARI